MSSVEELAQVVGTAQACDALSVARATLYRRRRPAAQPRPRPRPKRALAPEERENVLQVLRSERFVDKAPVQVYAELLDEGTYICSQRSMHRYLAAQGEIRERRNQLRHPVYTKPELLATAPNQVWSWDITKLKGPAKWTLFYLYVILDIFSRYVVGWMLSHAESAAQAKRLIGETCDKQGIVPGQLTIHADRGSSMRSQPVAGLMGKLGITKTHSRPHVSDDNPFSEAQFKTLKYCPEFPGRFGGFEDALAFGHRFFPYYNHEHRHSGIGLMTPFAVHYGLASAITASRQETLLAAFARTPERFVGGRPKPPVLPDKVWINPPRDNTTLQDGPGSAIGTLPDPRVALVFASAGSTALFMPTTSTGTLEQVQ
jgi:putative transposase